MNHPTKKMIKNYVRNRIANEDAQAIKALILVFNHQTLEEQNSDQTRISNNVGFSAFDAEFLSKLAKQYQQKKWLSVKQIAAIKKIMPKYWQQVVNACNYDKLGDMALTNYLSKQDSQQQALSL